MATLDIVSAMRIFVRVIERGSISVAARDLDMGQSTVSERINRLEEYLGIPLLYRHARTLTRTSEGEAFYSSSKAALDAVDDALAVAQEHREVRGTFRIGAPQGLGEIILPPVLLEIKAQYPGLYIDLDLNDSIVDPVTAGVDISLRLGRPAEGRGAKYRIGHVRRKLVAAPSYLAHYPEIEDPHELSQHRFIRVRGVYGDRLLELEDSGGEPVFIGLDLGITVSHWRAARELLLGGGGIGVLQLPACLDALNDGRLEQILPEYTVPGFDLHVILPVTRPIPAKTRAILQILEEQLPARLAGYDGKDV
ncbi:LysR family transcriptional regulator [Burkholderia ambifaria]|jgi:DNA-binding transcriptional LysR family regulator|uniref:Transcriptional regulator, LysR family n=1 Tax=Burkholderia ambifaria IOP40-10 TaxID=396596 RepID=B1F900_9BURK|nr:LysR family transcriptional regulator [Burkholderia ambifaria]EDT05922.1 transcriptional regulator, LysR family [Burkholderia ambifaria IOP40-10]